jgi:hypothetical protein
MDGRPKIGDVLWRMSGHRKDRDEETQWHAVPVCIEYTDEHKFLDAYRCGGSWNSIGKNYFMTREECLKDFETHRQEYMKPAVTSGMLHERKMLGSIVKDEKAFWRGEGILKIWVGSAQVYLNALPWKESDEPGEYGRTLEYVTLGAIREALLPEGIQAVVTVWYEDLLCGEIYQTGNYPGESAWRLHGMTQGYA